MRGRPPGSTIIDKFQRAIASWPFRAAIELATRIFSSSCRSRLHLSATFWAFRPRRRANQVRTCCINRVVDNWLGTRPWNCLLSSQRSWRSRCQRTRGLSLCFVKTMRQIPSCLAPWIVSTPIELSARIVPPCRGTEHHRFSTAGTRGGRRRTLGTARRLLLGGRLFLSLRLDRLNHRPAILFILLNLRGKLTVKERIQVLLGDSNTVLLLQ